MVVDFARLLTDLQVESVNLLACLAESAGDRWDEQTPAHGWTIRDQVSHLALIDEVTHLALTDALAFRIQAHRLTAGGSEHLNHIGTQHQSQNGANLEDWFSASRARLIEAFVRDDPRRRIPWFGPDMSVASSATARLMETWAHGRDVYDTVGATHPPSPGLRSIAHLGVITFGFAHRVHALDVPDRPVRVELRSPDGEQLWAWGPPDADERVCGPAEDFVLVVTQRRHLADTALVTVGDVASGWMGIAQAYAGPPGAGRARRMTPP